ncbi:type II toxin-antitoxin system RelE/ParE family toxin [Rheinheimera riviphila]|uniref:Type II toxin-antitoxin system RelE/ParE family toxin n=1 Tax=Rheinheimera riviphila TaxID=1834037 RepID=A0A437QZX5_9GAMM|nr:type II toxin-antitoxin system RelE/ParE family toxin [Rheinheimera riviphila]RVU40086.1 type II toxin-antitoxin system RelE/ParE family toxin [Rheinheimera riviphila]
MNIVWTALALNRVEQIALYIAEDKPDAAVQWVEKLFIAVERLAEFAESGRIVPEVRLPRIREVIFGTYRIIYSVKDEVAILTVRRSSQLLNLSELSDDQS